MMNEPLAAVNIGVPAVKTTFLCRLWNAFSVHVPLVSEFRLGSLRPQIFNQKGVTAKDPSSLALPVSNPVENLLIGETETEDQVGVCFRVGEARDPAYSAVRIERNVTVRAEINGKGLAEFRGCTLIELG